ncbi:hypothetical protein LZQ00_09090 [Sphingobacterium sp. SRCM116780]|uniref:hypothetical protein n=1 Tax=Sphingobacterium sp. SRCM116780 TaxID=2907623 RepID=UPI001F25526F|nr:hypothetical protein [Sphingobacterium sp. SRCM116780]UIR57961.1 hypothetical protein LZQ00_09090 [Sphingobacterium sp. SRCM116780]
MKVIKGIIISILVLVLIGLLFRGWIYRHLITYKSIGKRQNYTSTNSELTTYIDSCSIDKKELNIQEVIELSLSITAKRLNFSFSKNENNPNKLLYTKNAHCVGYAAFFTTTCNYLLKKYNLINNWEAKQQIGQLSFLSNNIHHYFDSPFFADHDYVLIKNKNNEISYAVDPTLNDYLHIDYVISAN